MNEVFNGTYTITNKDSKDHRTFNLKTALKGPLRGQRILSLLIGPNNEADYKGIAFVVGDQVRVWKAARGTDFERYGNLFQNLVLRGVPQLVEKFDVLVSRRCYRCNRKLTTPESIAAGIGPECELRS